MSRNKLWFGTENRMQFIKTPLRDADMSAKGWNSGGTLLDGGGWSRQSTGTHREYVFEWGDSNTREFANLLDSYRHGVYGTGLIYFVDPTIYTLNILPSKWSAPGTAPSLIRGRNYVGVATAGMTFSGLPVTSAVYDQSELASGYRGTRDSVFVPIPTGYTLHIGAFYTSTGTEGGVFAYPVSGGSVGASQKLTAVDGSGTILADSFTAVDGIRLQVGEGPDGSTTITALIGVLYPTSITPPDPNEFVIGMGNAGCRFNGDVMNVATTGRNGGMRRLGASFIEVG